MASAARRRKAGRGPAAKRRLQEHRHSQRVQSLRFTLRSQRKIYAPVDWVRAQRSFTPRCGLRQQARWIVDPSYQAEPGVFSLSMTHIVD